ncbi:MAG TPA: hypothetical protein VFC19_01055 [Candidatus Limnocylindrales bacterium]|nr:hypothetical protein [Candidatus Limnocylindrales bacterium]
MRKSRLCRGQKFIAAFDRQTGKQVWRKEIGISNILAGPFGVIVASPGNRSVVLDPDGRDVTPDSLGDRPAYWIDDESLIFYRQTEQVVITGNPDGMPLVTFELSVYPTVTREELPLGRHQLYGNCAGTNRRYVCPGRDGFIMFH